MSHQLKLNCPICNYPRFTHLSRHLTKVHGINGKERKALLLRARFSVLSMQPDHPQSYIQVADSPLAQFGNSLPETSSVPEQKKVPYPVLFISSSDENVDNLIPFPYDTRISYEKAWGTNVPVMD